MWADDQVPHARVIWQLDADRDGTVGSTAPPLQQKTHGSYVRRPPVDGFGQCGGDFTGTVEIHVVEEPGGYAAQVSAATRHQVQEVCGIGHDARETIQPTVLTSPPLLLLESFNVSRVFDLLSRIEAARMIGD